MSASEYEMLSYADALNAYLQNVWPNREFGATWTLSLPAKKHIRACTSL
jgi:hypothetical protein